jgi:leucyl/phenylalanyl-tRNA--protein transferase
MTSPPTPHIPGPDPDELLNAYAYGAFPMDPPEHAHEPVPYFSADPRAVIPIEDFRIPRSVARGIARTGYRIEIDRAFDEVLAGCANRAGDTWLSPRLGASYRRLFEAGFAHSVEAWDGSCLVGGLFGVALGGLFTSESMFHTATDAGNTVLVATGRHLRSRRFVLWDIQMATDHTMRFGTELLTADEYRRRLRRALGLSRRFVATGGA